MCYNRILTFPFIIIIFILSFVILFPLIIYMKESSQQNCIFQQRISCQIISHLQRVHKAIELTWYDAHFFPGRNAFQNPPCTLHTEPFALLSTPSLACHKQIKKKKTDFNGCCQCIKNLKQPIIAVELQQIKKTRAFKNICITITVNS